MAQDKSKAGTAGSGQIVVEFAGLVGVNWPQRRVSASVYRQPANLCLDLQVAMTKGAASVIGPASPNGAGWDDLVCWPGRGVFVVKYMPEEPE